MSQMTPASDGGKRRDESARDAVEIAAHDAIEALTESLAQYEVNGDDTIALAYTGLTLGHLRAILAALSAPYVPGMVEVDRETFGEHEDVALLTTWRDGLGKSSHWFAQVSR